MEPTAMETLLTSVTAVVTGAISWLSSVVVAITANPLLLLFVLVSLVGLGIGLLKRVISV